MLSADFVCPRPQQLLAAGIIPAGRITLFNSCPQYLPECLSCSVTARQHNGCSLCWQTDIAPLSDGSFCAFADSCKTPAGLGLHQNID
ncbi:hypothetical protein [Alishewanella longhuensis]